MSRAASIAVAQFAAVAGDPAASRERAVAMAQEAAVQGADLVLMPELMTTKYFALERNPDYFAWAEPIPGPTTDALAGVARAHRMYIVAPIFERTIPGVHYNSAALIGRNGELVGVYRKTHIPAVKSIEKWYFRPGASLPVFETDFGPVGILICQDRVFPEAARVLALKGAVLILMANLAADYAAIHDMWEPVIRTRAFENSVYVAASNRQASLGDVDAFGESLICGPMGEVLARAGAGTEVIMARLDLDELERTRTVHQVFRDLRPELYGPIADPHFLAREGCGRA